MRLAPFLLLSGALALPATAGTVSISIPRIDVAEYHRPYVAVWLEPAEGPARTVAVWYDVRNTKAAEPGTKWLADLRSWWRKGGRSLHMPADGISGATRAPGRHEVQLPRLAPGKYVLQVEAARETGGRELVSLPITLPATAPAQASGKTELGTISFAP